MVEKKRSICLFCSLGCGTMFRTAGEHVLAIDYDRDNPVNQGSLCPRGNYNFELLNHPCRLAEPQIGKRKASWRETIDLLRRRFMEFDPDSVGIVVSSLSSNEDACLAAKLAGQLGTKNIAAAADPADLEAYAGSKWEAEGAKLARIEKMGKEEALLIIGDVLTRSPVLAKRVNQVKYGKRGNRVTVIDPNQTHTSWFATTHLKNQPGTEALVLAAILKVVSEESGKARIDLNLEKVSKTVGIPQEVLVKAARDFNAAASGTIIFVPRETIARNDLCAYFARMLASLSPNKKYITCYGFGNTLGVNTILDGMVSGHLSSADLLKKVEGGQLKALLILGEDLAASHPELEKRIRGLELVAMSNYFLTPLTDDALTLLPLASHLENSASYTLADGRRERIDAAAPKVGTMSNAEIIAALLGDKVDLGQADQEAKAVVEKGVPSDKAELKQKLSEAQKITARKDAPELNITHFGNNRLVRNFFWYRVNNKHG